MISFKKSLINTFEEECKRKTFRNDLRRTYHILSRDYSTKLSWKYSTNSRIKLSRDFSPKI